MRFNLISSSLYEDVYLQPDGGPQTHPELGQDVEVELVFVLARLQPQHSLAQPWVRAVEVRPREEHGGAALRRRGRLCNIIYLSTHLTCRHIEQPLRRAAGLARGAEAGAVLGGEGLAAGHEPNR